MRQLNAMSIDFKPFKGCLYFKLIFFISLPPRVK